MKNIFDVLISIILIIIFSPIFMIIYLIILLSEKTNPLFTQKRVGKNGVLFNMYKFKTMINNNDNILKDYLESNPNAKKEWKRYKKLKNDPRVTQIGKFLRKTSIDELPQLINVLKGEMSLVGPRPYLEQEIPDMKDGYNYYIQVKPGITGLWQINGRNDVSFQKRVLLDIWYVKNRSFLLDLSILLKTIYVVFKKKGF